MQTTFKYVKDIYYKKTKGFNKKMIKDQLKID